MQIRRFKALAQANEETLDASLRHDHIDSSLFDKEVDFITGPFDEIWVEVKNRRVPDNSKISGQLRKTLKLFKVLEQGVTVRQDPGSFTFKHQFREIHYVFVQGLAPDQESELLLEAGRIMDQLHFPPENRPTVRVFSGH